VRFVSCSSHHRQVHCVVLSLMIQPSPRSTLFPYTTLFRSFETISNASYPGKWLVVFFWPKDFTFVCPTEIAEFGRQNGEFADRRSEEHTSELQSRENLVCRLLLEKKKRNTEVMQTT